MIPLNEIQELTNIAEQVAQTIVSYSHVRVISHNDADGLTSAAIICQTLLREDIPYHVTITSRLDEDVIETVNKSTSDSDLVVFCDMGSGQPDLIGKVKQDVVVIDHHQPVGESPATAAINPHMAGVDGATYLCASMTTYLVARQINANNVDLAGLAIAGAVGDKQLFGEPNKHILDEAVQAKIVSVQKGLKVGGGDIADVLENTPEPYLDITGNRDKIDEFLDILNIHGNIDELKTDELKKLISAIALKLTKNASPEAVDAAIGDVYILNQELIPNVYDMVATLNSCGKQDKYGLALALCMKDRDSYEEARSLTTELQKKVITDIKRAETMIQRGEHIWYLNAANLESTGIVASIVVRYIHPDMPFLAVNRVEDLVKVSSRGTRALIQQGLDLASALRETADAVGGQGGGHNIASGASIPQGTSEDFIRRVDEIVGKQLGGEGYGNESHNED
ncbi:MAG: DHH family phosphoesterase [Euryarchaeota archaeon]|nr:DHH family phosphoesterase [Euryarchaeota archaeon]